MSKQNRIVLLLVTLIAEGESPDDYEVRCINSLKNLIRNIKQVPPEESNWGQCGVYKEKAAIVKVDIIDEKDLQELKEW